VGLNTSENYVGKVAGLLQLIPLIFYRKTSVNVVTTGGLKTSSFNHADHSFTI